MKTTRIIMTIIAVIIIAFLNVVIFENMIAAGIATFLIWMPINAFFCFCDENENTPEWVKKHFENDDW